MSGHGKDVGTVHQGAPGQYGPWPVSVAALPIPAGAATELTQLANEALLTSIEAQQTDGTQKTQIVDGVNILDIDGAGAARIMNPPNLDAALSTRATEATLATRATEATLATRATEATLASVDAKTFRGAVDAGNSSSAALGIGGSFSGSAVDVSPYDSITVSAITDKAGTLYIEFSPDNVNWDHSVAYTITTATPNDYSTAPHARYLRVRFSNTSGAVQTYFRLQTLLSVSSHGGAVVPLDQTLVDHTHAQVTKSLITGKTTAGGGSFVDVKVNPSGAVAADVSGTVSGVAAAGAAASGNPVLIAGVDSSALIRRMLTDYAGRAQAQVVDRNGGIVGVDPFGRMRVGMAHTLADLIMRYEIDSRDWSQSIATGGTITYLPNQQAAALAVTGANGSTAILQTNHQFRYQAGKAQWIQITGYHSDTGQANQVREYGYNDGSDGLFFRLSGTTFSVVRQTFTSGVLAEAVVDQANWNVDNLLGGGGAANPSGVTLVLTNASIFEVEFQSLAVGDVYFRINGILVHVMRHAGLLTVPYMRTAQLPVRVRVANTGASVAGGFTLVCVKVESHGGTEPPMESFGAPATPVDVAVSTTELPLLAIRLSSTYGASGKVNRMVALPKLLSVSTASAAARWRLILNPTTLTAPGPVAPTWTAADPRSGVEFATNANAFTGGQTLHARTLTAAGDAQTLDISQLFDEEARNLRQTAFADGITNASDVLLITGLKVAAGSTNMRAAITWSEIR